MITVIRNLTFCIVAILVLSGFGAKKVTVDLPIKKQEVSSFNTIISDVTNINKKYGESNVLIVLDIDNTILTSSTDIGGDIWYQWQRGKLNIKPTEENTVSCLFEDSVGLLYELGTMDLTEETLPTVLSGWQANGNTVMALTSRAPKYRAATERELYNKGINLETAALAPIGQKAPVYIDKTDRALSYINGIMMTSGMNKGKMLSYILNKTQRHFDAVVFIDDSQKNIDNVFEEYKNKTDIDMNIYHYVKIEKDREAKYGAVLTQEHVEKMANDWVTLNNTLNTIFPKRKRQTGCLSIN